MGILTACTDNGIIESRDSNGVTTSQEISGREGGSERGGGEHGGSGGESSASGTEEGSGANLAPDETFDAIRGGARLIIELRPRKQHLLSENCYTSIIFAGCVNRFCRFHSLSDC